MVVSFNLFLTSLLQAGMLALMCLPLGVQIYIFLRQGRPYAALSLGGLLVLIVKFLVTTLLQAGVLTLDATWRLALELIGTIAAILFFMVAVGTRQMGEW